MSADLTCLGEKFEVLKWKFLIFHVKFNNFIKKVDF
jgi:hypothetical protein